VPWRFWVTIAAALVIVGSAGVASAAPAGAVSVWESGGLSPMTIEGVRVAASSQGASIHMRQSGSLRLMGVTRDGEDVQRPDPGFGYPMASLAVETDDPLLTAARRLGDRDVLMSERSAALRGARPGDRLEVEGWDRQVIELELVAVVPDDELDWYELVIPADVARAIAFDRDASMIIEGSDSGALLSAIRWLVRSPTVRVGTPDAPVAFTDPTLPTVVVKEQFGEFAFRPTGRADGIEIEEAWLEANIVDTYIEGLGPFRCNRAVMPYLRSVVSDLDRQGLMDEIVYDDFQIAGGCFNSRMMRGGDKGYALSRHAWGIAIDINPSTNPYGGPTELTSDVGNTFRRWGFSWGATWTVPDGMHFEWAGAPAELETCADVRLVEPTSSSVTWSVQPADEAICVG
jgi:hypothetical protein